MASGVSGAAEFSLAGNTLRVYYSQSFTPGVGVSHVTVSRVTVQCGVNYGCSFFFDGKILLNGREIFSASIAGSDGGVRADLSENTVNLFTNGAVDLAHTGAAALTVSLRENTRGNPCIYSARYGILEFPAGDRTVTLSPIPMASRLSVTAGELGTEITVRLQRAAPGMTDTVSWQCGGLSGVLAENTAAEELSWTPPLSLAEQVPEGDGVPLTLTTRTKNGDTEAGLDSLTLTLPIPAAVAPTVSMTLSDDRGYPALYGGYLAGQSQIRAAVAAAGAYGSRITGVTVTCGGMTAAGESPVFTLSDPGQAEFTARVTDSRGRTAVCRETAAVLPYVPPVPTVGELYRCGADGNRDPAGSWGLAVLSCPVTELSGKNAPVCTLRYRVRGTESWTETETAVPGTCRFPADPGKDYQVQLTARDNFVSAAGQVLLLPAAFALLDFDRVQRAVGVGQRAGTAGTLSLGLDMKMGQHRITDLAPPQSPEDAVTKGYADGKRQTFYVALPPNWTGTGPYRQTLAVDGILETDMPHITPMCYWGAEATDDTARAVSAQWAHVSWAAAGNGEIRFVCYEEPTSAAFVLQIEVMR